MKFVHKLLLTISSTVLFSCFLTLNNLKTPVNSKVVLAQSQSEINEIIKRVFNSSKVIYRTAKLRHKNTNTKAYLEVTLKPRFNTEAIYLFIETNGQIKKLPRNFGFKGDGLIYLNPIAFSPDGRYLIIEQGEFMSDVGDLIFVDLKNNYRTLNFNLIRGKCDVLDHQGFITLEKVLFDCSNFGRGQQPQPIVLNLNNGNFRDFSQRSFDLLPPTYDRLGKLSIID